MCDTRYIYIIASVFNQNFYAYVCVIQGGNIYIYNDLTHSQSSDAENIVFNMIISISHKWITSNSFSNSTKTSNYSRKGEEIILFWIDTEGEKILAQHNNSSRTHDFLFTGSGEGLAGEEGWPYGIYFWHTGTDSCEVFNFFCTAYLSEQEKTPAGFILEQDGSSA